MSVFHCGIASVAKVPQVFHFLLLMYNFIPSLGVRLYFSTCPFRQPLARPNTLTLVHVRLPPGFSASSTVEKPSKVHKALYSKGRFCYPFRFKIGFFKLLKCHLSHLKIINFPVKFGIF